MAKAKVRDWSKASAPLTTDVKRFARSRHARDLFLIASLAAAHAVVAIVAAVFWGLAPEVAAVLVAAFLAAMAWAFQAANLRFGAADIFASEIQTLCRISAVNNFIQRLVEGYKVDGQPVQPGQSTQDYVVIFHNNSKDLEILDGTVVTWVTEFYVYFKAMLDTMSRLPRRESKALPAEEIDQYKEALLGAIYMAFLMFESGRRGLMRLIDDQMLRKEAVLSALVSEVPAYLFLYDKFQSMPADIRAQRICARLPYYLDLLEDIAQTAREGLGPHSASARICALAKEVISRWNSDAGSLKAFDAGEPVQPILPPQNIRKAA